VPPSSARVRGVDVGSDGREVAQHPRGAAPPQVTSGVMSDRTQGEILIDAPVGRVLDVIGDVEKYPEWATGTTRAEVTQEGDAPLRPRRAKFTLETVLKDVFELE